MSDYGAKFTNASGLYSLEPDETYTRVVHEELVPLGFSGTFSVPDFDDTKGMFYVTFDSGGSGGFAFNPFALPNLQWDNTAKTMTVTPATLPPGFMNTSIEQGKRIVFLHYR